MPFFFTSPRKLCPFDGPLTALNVPFSDGTLPFWKRGQNTEKPNTEHVIIAGDMSGHIGATSREGFERWHGGNGYGQLNKEGRVIMQCAQMFDLAICNTFYN